MKPTTSNARNCRFPNPVPSQQVTNNPSTYMVPITSSLSNSSTLNLSKGPFGDEISAWHAVPARKRGRKSLQPPAQREYNRRVKKQNMERRRRACISEKLATLHRLAVSLVGDQSQQQPSQRTEVTDILSQCVSVFKGLSDIVKENPELQRQLQLLGIASRGSTNEKNKPKAPSDSEFLASEHPSERMANRENFHHGNFGDYTQNTFQIPRARCSAFTSVNSHMPPVLTSCQLQYQSDQNFCYPTTSDSSCPSLPLLPPKLTPYDLPPCYSNKPASGTCTLSHHTHYSPIYYHRRNSLDSCYSTPSSSSPGIAFRSPSQTDISPTSMVWRPYLD